MILNLLGVKSKRISQELETQKLEESAQSVFKEKVEINMTDYMRGIRTIRDSQSLSNAISFMEETIRSGKFLDYDKLRILKHLIDYKLKDGQEIDIVKDFFENSLQQLKLEKSIDIHYRIAKCKKVFSSEEATSYLNSFILENEPGQIGASLDEYIEIAYFFISEKKHEYAITASKKAYLLLSPYQRLAHYTIEFRKLIKLSKDICIMNRVKKNYNEYLFFALVESCLNIVYSLHRLHYIAEYRELEDRSRKGEIEIDSGFLEALENLGIAFHEGNIKADLIKYCFNDLPFLIINDGNYVERNQDTSKIEELLNEKIYHNSEKEDKDYDSNLSFIGNWVNETLSKYLP